MAQPDLPAGGAAKAPYHHRLEARLVVAAALLLLALGGSRFAPAFWQAAAFATLHGAGAHNTTPTGKHISSESSAQRAVTAPTNSTTAYSIVPSGKWLPVPLSVRRAPPSALPSYCPQPGATPTHVPAGDDEGEGADGEAAGGGDAATVDGGSSSGRGGEDGDDYGDGDNRDASSTFPAEGAVGAPRRAQSFSPSAAAALSGRGLARCEFGSARCREVPPIPRWQSKRTVTPGQTRWAASGSAAALANATARKISTELLLDHAFAALRCATCTPVYVGTECPPGDVLPATHNFTLELAKRYEGYKTSPPHTRPAARAMMKYLGSTGCAFWRRGAFRTCASLIEGEFTTRAGLSALRWGFPWARFNVPAAAPVPLGHPVRGAGKPLCSVSRPADVSTGHSDDTTGLWVPQECRLPYRFPHALLSRCLAGKRLLIVGDSLLRQFAGRFVATIRGQPLFAEHEIGSGARYTWDIAGGRDEWVSASSTEEHIRDAGGRLNFSTGDGAAFAASSFTLVRQGNVVLDDWEAVNAAIDGIRPTHVVFGTNYWLKGAESASAAARVARALPRSLRPRAGTSALRSFVWYETPCFSAREFASTGHLTRGDWAMHQARNPQFRSELTRLWRVDHPAGLQNVSLGFLPNCALGKQDVSSHVLDNTHYACRWHPFPQPGMTSEPITSIKATADFDCTDHLDLTGVRLLLASMCPEEFHGDGGAEWEA